MTDDLHEEGEPLDEVRRAFDSAPTPRTADPVGWTCPHMTMTSASGLLARAPSVGCGCIMTPIFT